MLLMEYLDRDWVTIGEFCKSELTVDEELIKKIGDAFLDALYFLNQYGFSIDHIEHYDNVMINTKTHDIKLIDIAKPLRIALTGRIVPTGIYELIYALGKEDTLTRISQHLYK